MTALPFPTKAEIKRAVTAFAELGFEIGGVEVSKDGTVRVLPPLAGPPKKLQTQAPRSWDE